MSPSTTPPKPLPVEKLPVDSEALTKLAELKIALSRPPKVTENKGEVTVTCAARQDLFYTKTIFEMQTALNQIRKYRIEEEYKAGAEARGEKKQKIEETRSQIKDMKEGKNPSDLTSAPKPDPAAIKPPTPAPMEISVGEKKPTSLVFKGDFVREKTAADFPIDASDPIAKALAALIQMLFIFLANQELMHQKGEIHRLRSELLQEMALLEALDKKSPSPTAPPSRAEIAFGTKPNPNEDPNNPQPKYEGQLPAHLKGYLDNTALYGKLESARQEFYSNEGKGIDGKDRQAKVDPQGLDFQEITALMTKSHGYSTLQSQIKETELLHKAEAKADKAELRSATRELQSLITAMTADLASERDSVSSHRSSLSSGLRMSHS